jgi:hypothetical protein
VQIRTEREVRLLVAATPVFECYLYTVWILDDRSEDAGWEQIFSKYLPGEERSKKTVGTEMPLVGLPREGGYDTQVR